MYSIDVLMQEHANIFSMAKVVRAVSLALLSGIKPDLDDYRSIIEFVRRYSDDYHHGKEEKILFARMTEELGPVAEKMIRQGMLVEHDLGRFYIHELEEAVHRYEQSADEEDRLELIVCAMEWAKLLEKHAEREDDAVYPLAIRRLPENIKEEIDRDTRRYEIDAADMTEVNRLLNIVDKLSDKYKAGVRAIRPQEGHSPV